MTRKKKIVVGCLIMIPIILLGIGIGFFITNATPEQKVAVQNAVFSAIEEFIKADNLKIALVTTHFGFFCLALLESKNGKKLALLVTDVGFISLFSLTGDWVMMVVYYFGMIFATIGIWRMINGQR